MKPRIAIPLIACLLFCFQSSLLAQFASSEREQSIYQFEHKAIPYWLFQDNSTFFESISQGGEKQLKTVAQDMVDKPFADALSIETIEEGQSYLITFEEPLGITLCYCAIITRTPEGYAYYTLEKTFGSDDDDIKTMYCAWTKEGAHENYGPRNYTDPESFTKEFLSNQQEQ